MAQGLVHQAAVVTGATRGIGRAIAEALLREGARVAICGRRQDAVEKAARELAPLGQVCGKACDVGRFEQVQEFFCYVAGQFGGLDVLVNNAGIGGFVPVHETSPEHWRAVIDTNLSGPFYCVHEAVPLLKKNGGGFIFNIGSLAGKMAFAGGAAYNASKFGLHGFSEAIMLDLRYDNIRVAQIMPGSVHTEFGSPAASQSDDWKISPEHVAEIVVDLLKLPARSLASRVELRPSRPPKK
jgi:NAD(P)-dependent dehydrogenase (short-subunit alcohol dehydrogenase family)